MANTYLKAADENSFFIRVLKRALKTSSINIVKTEQQAQAVLSVSNELHEKRVLSVDSQGRALEYEINYQISFNVSADENNFSIEE